jgi:hypothetical protein
MVSNGSANYNGSVHLPADTQYRPAHHCLLQSMAGAQYCIVRVYGDCFLDGVVHAYIRLHTILGFIYASIFYALYFAINIANNVRENKKFIASDFSILLINTGLVFCCRPVPVNHDA